MAGQLSRPPKTPLQKARVQSVNKVPSVGHHAIAAQSCVQARPAVFMGGRDNCPAMTAVGFEVITCADGWAIAVG